jgi:hypothetical protein
MTDEVSGVSFSTKLASQNRMDERGVSGFWMVIIRIISFGRTSQKSKHGYYSPS